MGRLAETSGSIAVGRLKEGTHYFEVNRRDSPATKFVGGETPPGTEILLTGRGYLLLVKSFKDERAWEIQDGLVEHYFRSIEQLPSGHLAQLHHEELVARVIGRAVREGMEEFISPVRSDIRCLDVKVDEVKTEVCEVKTEVCSVKTVVDDIESRVSDLERGKRKKVSPATMRQHRETVRAYFQGLCPCCAKVEVVDETICETSIANVDHWYRRNKNEPHQTWIVCAPCNQRFENDHDFKVASEVNFKFYQKRREQLVCPLLYIGEDQ